MPDALRRFTRPREGWLSLGLLLVMLLALTWSVQSAGWLEQLDFLMPVAIYGALAGAVLALLPVSVVVSLPTGALLGCLIVLWTVGGEYFTSFGQLGRLLALREESIGLAQSVLNQAYPTQLAPYAVGLGVLMWSIAFMAAYTLYRHHRVLDAILLIAAALIANMSATFSDLFGYLVLFVLAALLLWLRAALLSRQESWQQRRVNENAEVPVSIMRSGIGFIAGSIVLAWVLTSIAVAAPLTGAWRNLDGVWTGVRDNLDGVFGNLTNPDSRFSGTTFGSRFRVSGTWVSNDAPVMTVGSRAPYYMRTITYDSYTGHGWDRSGGTTRSAGAGDLIFPAATPERPTVATAFSVETVSVQVQGQIGRNIFTPGFPITALVPVTVYQTAGQPVLGGLEAANAIASGDGYQITAAISNATESELSKAGSAYPADVRRLYLSTDGVSARTRQLAEKIIAAAGARDPYHKASALADFLRTSPEFTYATSVDPPDPNRDLVDQFLFDPNGRRGYCEYYASAMAVMARSVGLPSRVAVGFAPGQRLASGIYQYRERNAHAWVEIYFPGYGWQSFEATKSISPVLRASGAEATPITPPSGRGGVNQDPPFFEGEPGVVSALPSFRAAPDSIRPGQKSSPDAARNGNLGVIGALLLLALAVLAWRLLRSRRRWRFMAPGDRQWQRLTLAADRAGVAQRPSETIYEYAGWLEAQIPRRQPEIRTIANGKVWQTYSGRSMSESAIERIERAWARMRVPLVWLGARRGVQRFLHPRRPGER